MLKETYLCRWDLLSLCSCINALVRCGYVEEDVMLAMDVAVCAMPRSRFSTQVKKRPTNAKRDLLMLKETC
jgi:hypothetical protein